MKEKIEKYLPWLHFLSIALFYILLLLIFQIPHDPYDEAFWKYGIKSISQLDAATKLLVKSNLRLIIFLWGIGIINFIFYIIYRYFKKNNMYSIVVATICFTLISLYSYTLLKNGDYATMQYALSDVSILCSRVFLFSIFYWIWTLGIGVLVKRVKEKYYSD